MATALKFHPGSLIKESHLFQAHVCFECSQPLFDPTVRHFLVPHDIKVVADMKCVGGACLLLCCSFLSRRPICAIVLSTDD